MMSAPTELIRFILATVLCGLLLAGCGGSSDGVSWRDIVGGGGSESESQSDGTSAETGGSRSAEGSAPASAATGHYVFVSFRAEDTHSLYLSYSTDGMRWRPLNDGRAIRTFKHFRDPNVILGADGQYHMVWTTGQPKSIGYATSPDLLNWSKKRALPIMQSEALCKNCWAPEVNYDPASRRYLVHFSSMVSDKPYSEITDRSRVQQIYGVWTKDFKTFSKPFKLYDPGYSVIDSSIIKANGTFYLFFKDDRNDPWHQFTRYATSKRLEGPYGSPSDRVGAKTVEGVSPIRIGDEWFVYYDHFGEKRYGGMVSKDLRRWTDRSMWMSFPKGTRHGSAIEVPPDLAAKLLAYSSATVQ